MDMKCVGTDKQTRAKGKWANESGVTGLMSTELFLYPAYRRNMAVIYEDIAVAQGKNHVAIDNNSTLEK